MIHRRATDIFQGIITILIVAGYSCDAAASKTYAAFRQACGTNKAPFQVSIFRELVDTNNTGRNFQAIPISITQAKNKGEINGLRLGMDMDEVVGVRGKPNFLQCCITNKPCFSYGDVILQFGGDEVVGIELNGFLPWTPRFTDGLAPISKMEDWLKVLGEPAKTYTNGSMITFQFMTNRVIATVRFDTDDKQLVGFKLTKAAAPPAGSGKP